MRNLKRALSLALASVMLLGMMVVGTSAANVKDFTDADQIVNSEAAAITSGLGLFAGYEVEEGVFEFRPEEEVNRAIMAAVIGKMVNGTKLNFNIFKGNSPFTDLTGEYSWAEGYANWCHSTGIANGYGNGVYGAADTVTTWQAALMLQRALGYWDKKDTSSVTGPAGINELSVMAKASELGMLGDLELKANQPLTRDELSVMLYETLWAQMAKYDSGRGVYVKYNNQDVTIGKSTADAENTLAYTTFGLMIEEGVIVSNSAVDPALAATDSTAALTTVKLANGEEVDYEYETGINLIGHAVNVYFAVENKETLVYAITDQATVTGMITYDTYNNMNIAAVAEGFKSKSLPSDSTKYFVNYDLSTTVGELDALTLAEGDYMVLISNRSNKAVDYVIVLDQYLDVVTVDTNSDDELVYSTAVWGDEYLSVYGEVEDQDYVIVTETCYDSNGSAGYAIVEAADVLSATITKITGKSTVENDYRTITTTAGKYTQSPVEDAFVSDITPFQQISELETTVLIVDTYGKLIALDAVEEEEINYVYVAQFGYKYGTINNLKDKIVLSAHVYYADGTNEIVLVDTTKNDGDSDPDNTAAAIIDTVAEGIEDNYSKLNNSEDDAYAVGLYYLQENKDGTVDLCAIDGLETVLGDDEGAYNDESEKAAKTDNKFIKGHSTITNSRTYVKDSNDEVMYMNRNTVYFYVDGDYETDTLEVKVLVGVANMAGFTHGSSGDKLVELYTYDGDGNGDAARVVVEAAMITGVYGGATSVGTYYYNEGNYHIESDNGKYVLTYEVYNSKGTLEEISYSFDKLEDARSDARTRSSGYYTFKDPIGKTTPVAVVGESNVEGNTGSSSSIIYYAAGVKATGSELNQFTDNYEYNLFTTATDEGFIYTNAKVIDLTGNNVNTVKKLYDAVNDDELTITVSYSYKGSTYESTIIYVVGYVVTPKLPGQPKPETETAAELLLSVKVNGAIQKLAGAYKTAADAIKNATAITMNSGDNQSYKIDVKALDNGSAGEYWGIVAVYGDKAAALSNTANFAATPVEKDKGLSESTNASTLAAGQLIAEGNYIVIKIAKTQTENSYYAYYFTK